MKPSEQTNLIEFLKNLLPSEYYCVANDDYVEIHKVEVSEDDEHQKPQLKFHL